MRNALPLLLLAPLAIAQTPAAGQLPEPVATGSLGITFTNQYFFRGIAQENQGFIAQPWIELGYSLYEGDEAVRSIGLNFGLWNSLHDGPTGGAGGVWYESDFYVGLSTSIGERWNAGAVYTVYHSPNGSFGTVEELAFSARFDDRNVLIDALASGLQPSIVVACETDGQADGQVAGHHVGIYAQFGVEPSFSLGEFGAFDVTLALPATLGVSLSDYYEDVNGASDDAFGFLDVGVVASSPLPFLPSRMGPWTGELALHWLLLGNNNEERNAGDTTELILSFGLATVF